MVLTCFIFAKYLNDEGCLSLVLNQQAEVYAPLEIRSIDDIKKLQNNTKTIVVLSTEHASLFFLELPWIAEKKARTAIPFALEEELADSIEKLHFAFDRNQQNRYLIAVCEKSLLQNLISTLSRLELYFDKITLDWFALQSDETCIMDSKLLINNVNFCGSLPFALASRYLDTLADEQKIYQFKDSLPLAIAQERVSLCNEEASLWISKRLQQSKSINLCQGPFQQSGTLSTLKRWYWAASAMALLSILTVFLLNGLNIYQLNRQTKAIDAEIATAYRYFFPKAVQIISPRFRIAQLLKSQKNDENHSFWHLLNQLSAAVKDGNTRVTQLQFQNNSMKVTLIAKNFDALEAVLNFLKIHAIRVKQSEAVSRDAEVVSTLELSV